MSKNKDEIIHDLNNLTVKFKSICTLLLDEEDCGIDREQMFRDGALTLDELATLWSSVKKQSEQRGN